MKKAKWSEIQATQDGMLKSFIRRIIYSSLSRINVLIKKKKRILIYADGYLEDSNQALALYLLKNTNYVIYCHTNRRLSECEKYDGIHYTSNLLLLIYYCLTSKVIVETHTQQIKFHPKNGQLILQMWHGAPLKKATRPLSTNPKNNLAYYFTMITYPSGEFKKGVADMFGATDDQMFLNGYPRSDCFYLDISEEKVRFLKGFCKCIIWLPTYRNAPSLCLGERFEKVFPVVDKDNIVELNNFLSERNVLLIIKLHPLQENILDIPWKQSNIMKIDNDFLSKKKLPLYTLLSKTDALITDYSSVFFEYALLDRPIGFAIDDIREYGKINGFNVEQPEDFLCGNKIYDIVDLFNFIDEVITGKDAYREEREKVKNLTNYYQDGFNSKRIKVLIEEYMR